MDTAQWPQEIVVKPMEEIVVSHIHHPHGHGHIVGGGGGVPSSNNKQASSTSVERKVRPQKDQALNCPRCNSSNTKFCYYNNYSLTQPRYFCKTCRRYWTEGGSLRNIPVGGGSRKNKRVPSSSSASSNIINNNNNFSSSISSNAAAAAAVASNSAAPRMMGKLPNLVVTPSSILANHPANSYQNPKNFLHHHHEGLHDLNLGFSTPTPAPAPAHHQEFRGLCDFIQLPSTHMETATTPKTSPPSATTTAANNIPPPDHNHNQHHHPHPHPHTHPQLSALQLINGLASSRGGGLASFMSMPMADPNSVYSPAAGGFHLQHPDHFKPTLSFTLDGGGYGGGEYGGDLRDSLGDQRGASNDTSNDNRNNNDANDNHHRNNINGSSAGTGRFLFPFEDLKQRGTRVAAAAEEDHRHDIKDHRSSAHEQQQRQQEENREREATAAAAGYWRGMLLGGTAAGTAAGSSW